MKVVIRYILSLVGGVCVWYHLPSSLISILSNRIRFSTSSKSTFSLFCSDGTLALVLSRWKSPNENCWQFSPSESHFFELFSEFAALKTTATLINKNTSVFIVNCWLSFVEILKFIFSSIQQTKTISFPLCVNVRTGNFFFSSLLIKLFTTGVRVQLNDMCETPTRSHLYVVHENATRSRTTTPLIRKPYAHGIPIWIHIQCVQCLSYFSSICSLNWRNFNKRFT